MTLDYEVIGNGAFAMAAAILAALLAVWFQLRHYRMQLADAQRDQIISEKKRIIETLISYRYVLSDHGRYDKTGVSNFNAALSAVPVHFSGSRECMDKYRAFGDGFTAAKFFDFVAALMREVPLPMNNVDAELLENIPTVPTLRN